MFEDFLRAVVLAGYRTDSRRVLEVLQALTDPGKHLLRDFPPEIYSEAIERLDKLGKPNQISRREDETN